MKKRKNNLSRIIIISISILISIILIMILVRLYLSIEINQSNTNNINNISPLTVTKVIDGDTFQLNNKEIVRLICIDAPELGKKGSEQAKAFLEFLILGKEVILEKDVSDKDKYNRLLRYVWVNAGNVTQGKLEEQVSEERERIIASEQGVASENGEHEIFVNKEMVQQGYATIFKYGNDTKRCGEIENTQ